MKRIMIAVLMLLALGVTAQDTIKIKFGNGSDVKVRREGNEWECKIPDRLVAKVVEGRDVSLLRNDEIVATGNLKSDKLVLSKPDGTAYAGLNFKAEKIKITLGDDAKVWELKDKGEKYKVRVGEVEFGKVQYYPDNQKNKAKDASGNTVAETKSIGRRSASLGAYLIANADDETKAFLLMILLALGK